jgi:hypothetical protein
MGKLIFYRDKNDYFLSLRGIDVFLNNKIITSIGKNDIYNLDLPKGEYLINFKIDWIKSKPYRISFKNEDEEVKVKIGFFKSIKNKKILYFYCIEAIVLIPFFTFFYSDFGLSIKILGIIYLLFVLYRFILIILYMTVWRKKYFKVEIR